MKMAVFGLIGALACLGSAAAATPRPNAMIAEVMRLDEACRGGNVGPKSAVCRKRDRINAEVERAGWCWAYSDWHVSPVAFQWHRCTIARPKGYKNDPAFG